MMAKTVANFLWEFEDDSIETAGYEFANAMTEEYRHEAWLVLLACIKEEAESARDAALREVERLREALLSTATRGALSDPCWCASLMTEGHHVYCRNIRAALGIAEIARAEQEPK
jgi:hypothetical protein